eukprot:738496-Hanusia_phi.AAC.1
MQEMSSESGSVSTLMSGRGWDQESSKLSSDGSDSKHESTAQGSFQVSISTTSSLSSKSTSDGASTSSDGGRADRVEPSCLMQEAQVKRGGSRSGRGSSDDSKTRAGNEPKKPYSDCTGSSVSASSARAKLSWGGAKGVAKKGSAEKQPMLDRTEDKHCA